MDGWTVARKIRDGEAGADLSDIPIAVITGEVHAEKQCREIGVDDFMTKPLCVDRVRDFAERLNSEEFEEVALSN